MAAPPTGRGPVGTRLVAYVTAAPGMPVPTPADLLRHLADRLPAYMVPAEVVILETIPRLPNGKVDRRALAARPTAAAFGSDATPPRDERERRLAGVWQAVLGLTAVGTHDDFFEVGGDSLTAIQVVSRSRQAGFGFGIRDLFAHPTIAALAALDGAVQAQPSEAPEVTTAPLTPIQHWLLTQPLARPQHWNQGLLLRAAERVDPGAIRAAVEALVLRHGALRTGIARRQGRLAQELVAPAWVLRTVRLGAATEAERAAATEALANELHQALDLGAGRLLAVGCLDTEDATGSLVLLVAHHLAVDAVSWRILAEDFDAAYAQARSGAASHLEAGGATSLAYAAALSQLARQGAFDGDVDFWQAQFSEPVPPLPPDTHSAANLAGTARCCEGALGADDTARLTAVPAAPGRHPVAEAFLAAVAHTIAGWAGGPTVRVEMEGHGRFLPGSPLDVSRAVGWFTTAYPLQLRAAAPGSPADWLAAVRASMERLPSGGIGFGALRYLLPDHPAAGWLAAQRPPEIACNYLGSLDGRDGRWFAIVGEAPGQARAPQDPRRYLLELNAWLRAGRLCVRITYSEAVHRAATIEALLSQVLHTLQALARQVAPADAPPTGPDAPYDLAPLDGDELARLMTRLGSDA
jgi:non-ribosomal peptide synthase protein (TIGR01720 family)